MKSIRGTLELKKTVKFRNDDKDLSIASIIKKYLENRILYESNFLDSVKNQIQLQLFYTKPLLLDLVNKEFQHNDFISIDDITVDLEQEPHFDDNGKTIYKGFYSFYAKSEEIEIVAIPAENIIAYHSESTPILRFQTLSNDLLFLTSSYDTESK
ncbi:hypothetical protein ACVW0P_004496 [Mucilaginibacter sp. UYNi724]